MVGPQAADEVLEQVLRVALSGLYRLQDDDAALQRDGQSRQLDVRSELAALFTDTRECLVELGELDAVVTDGVEGGLPLLQSADRVLRRGADGVNRGVQAQRRPDSAAVQQERCGLVDGVATAVELVAFLLQSVTVQLLQELSDALDGSLSLAVGMSAHSDGDRHENQRRCDSQRGSSSRRADHSAGGSSCRGVDRNEGCLRLDHIARGADQVAVDPVRDGSCSQRL